MAILLAGGGCSKKSEPREPGFLTVAIHDAPDPNVTQLIVSIAKLRVREAGTENWIDLPANPAPFDLLTLQNGRFVDVLTNAKIPSGTYDELRLILKGDPTATVNGKQYSVKAPSCETSGCKLKPDNGQTIAIAPNQCTRLSVDFDGRRSIKPNPQHDFILEPVLRVDVIQVVACSGGGGGPTRTPEEALEAFIRALESHDAAQVLPLLSASIRSRFQPVLPKLDLGAMAYQLRQSTPVRQDDPNEDDERATFLSKQTVTGKVVDVPITLVIEGDAWKISTF